jgi:hypothetical protein
MQCPACTEVVDDDSAYCDQCGVQILRCQFCKTPGRGKRCTKCGAPMISLGTAPEPAVPGPPLANVGGTRRLDANEPAPSTGPALRLMNNTLGLDVLIENNTTEGRESGVPHWLKGKYVAVHQDSITATYPPFRISPQEEVRTTAELAKKIKDQPDRGKKLLYSGKISAWVNILDHALAEELDKIVEMEYPRAQDAGVAKAVFLLDQDEPLELGGRACRTPQELSQGLDATFAQSQKELANAMHAFYLFLEAHEARQEADTFRTYFKTFSAKRALNAIIIELQGRTSIEIGADTINTPEGVLRHSDQGTVASMLKDADSRISVWMNRHASPTILSRLQQWRALEIADERTLSFVSEDGDGVPLLYVDQKSISFNEVRKRSVVSGKFQIRNDGGSVISGSMSSDKKWLSLGKSEIDPTRRMQDVDFAIDTRSFSFGATDTAIIEVQSIVGTERVIVSLEMESGADVVNRRRIRLAHALGVVLPPAVWASLAHLFIHVGDGVSINEQMATVYVLIVSVAAGFFGVALASPKSDRDPGWAVGGALAIALATPIAMVLVFLALYVLLGIVNVLSGAPDGTTSRVSDELFMGWCVAMPLVLWVLIVFSRRSMVEKTGGVRIALACAVSLVVTVGAMYFGVQWVRPTMAVAWKACGCT